VRDDGNEAISERSDLGAAPVIEQPLGAALSVRDLHVEFPTDDGLVKAVDGLSYDVYPNEVLGIVGESGSGKSVSSLAILGLLPKRARIRGQIIYQGRDLLALPEREMLKLRGDSIAMVFQDALAALNPVYTVGAQIAEAVRTHHPDASKDEARKRAIRPSASTTSPTSSPAACASGR
jgi:ABC-type glutathione transport system ATPase component